MVSASHVWEKALHKGNAWLQEVSGELGWEDLEATLLALRSVLHALRDRLTPNEAVQLAAQFPLLIKGVYFDGWHLRGTPVRARRKGVFLAMVRSNLIRGIPEADPERVTRAVFKVLARHVSEGEISDVRAMLPAEMRDLWPDPVHHAPV